MPGRVLIISDNKSNIAELEQKLANEFYDILVLGDGGQALEKVKELAPDIVLLDAGLPDVTVPDICRELRGDSHTMHIPMMVILDENVSQSERIQYLASTVFNFVRLGGSR